MVEAALKTVFDIKNSFGEIRRHAEITCLLENGRDCTEIKSLFREIRVN